MSDAPVERPITVRFLSYGPDGAPLERAATVAPSATVYEAARQAGVTVPTLCHRPELGLDPAGVCRVCLVDVGERNYAAACVRPCGTLPVDGPKKPAAGEPAGPVAAAAAHVVTRPVVTTSPGLESVRRTLLEMLLAEHPRPCKRHQETQDCELELLGERYGLLEPLRRPAAAPDTAPNEDAADADAPRFPSRRAGGLGDGYGRLVTLLGPRPAAKPADASNPSIAVDHAACILCDRCTRACHDVAGHKVVGRVGKGAGASVGFDLDQPMADSGCVNCGWCMIACPTGAITYTGGPAPAPLAGGELLTVDQMLALAPIRDNRVSPQFLKRSEGGVARRRLNKGDVICRQGEAGHTAFFLESGSVQVYLEQVAAAASAAANPAAAAPRGLFARLSAAVGRTPVVRKDARTRRVFIPVDADVELAAGDPVATLNAPSVFGENSCRNGTPRSATVRAAEDGTVVIEVFRNFLDVLSRDPAFRRYLDASYRRRAVHTHLRTSALFRDLPLAPGQDLGPALDGLVDRVRLVSYKPGEVIIRQGDAADAFYLIRLGSVRVTKDFGRGGPPRTINYLSQGQYFGESELLRPERVPEAMRAEARRRLATCTAMDHVEVVWFGADAFDTIVAEFPGVEGRLAEEARRRYRSVSDYAATAKPNDPLFGEYLRQDLYQGQSLLVLDLEKCTRCDECVRACAQAHDGVTRLLRDGVRFDKYLVTGSCRSCRDPKCLNGCPVDAIHRREGTAIVIEDHCVGCSGCADQCPYNNIRMEPVTWADPVTGERRDGKRAMVCDLDNCLGEVQEPSCVYACPHDAAHRMDGPDLLAAVRAGAGPAAGK